MIYIFSYLICWKSRVRYKFETASLDGKIHALKNATNDIFSRELNTEAVWTDQDPLYLAKNSCKVLLHSRFNGCNFVFQLIFCLHFNVWEIKLNNGNFLTTGNPLSISCTALWRQFMMKILFYHEYGECPKKQFFKSYFKF